MKLGVLPDTYYFKFICPNFHVPFSLSLTRHDDCVLVQYFAGVSHFYNLD